MTPNGLVETAEFDTRDGIYDCAWSEVCLFILILLGKLSRHSRQLEDTHLLGVSLEGAASACGVEPNWA